MSIYLVQAAWDLHTNLFVGCIPPVNLRAEHAISPRCLALVDCITHSSNKFGQTTINLTYLVIHAILPLVRRDDLRVSRSNRNAQATQRSSVLHYTP